MRNAAPEWDNRFNITTSKGNHNFHDYYREYFGKPPKRFASSFRIKYASSTNELPGITDVGTALHCKVKEFKSLPGKQHESVVKVLAETRAPIRKG